MTRRNMRVLTFGAAVVAALSMTGASFAASASVKLGPTGQLRGGGAAVTVTVGAVCGPFAGDGTQSLTVQVTQKVGNQIASGFGSTDQFVCDGTVQQVPVSAAATTGSQPFVVGEAFVQASLGASGGAPDFTFESASTDGEVEVS